MSFLSIFLKIPNFWPFLRLITIFFKFFKKYISMLSYHQGIENRNVYKISKSIIYNYFIVSSTYVLKSYFYRRGNLFGYPEILLYSIRIKVANQTMMTVQVANKIVLICSMSLWQVRLFVGCTWIFPACPNKTIYIYIFQHIFFSCTRPYWYCLEGYHM